MDIYVYLYALANVFLFSDNAANFYNLANANRTQIGKESKLRGTSVGYNKEMGRKDVLSTDHDTQSDTKGRHTRFSASFSSLFAIKNRSSHFFPSVKFYTPHTFYTSYAFSGETSFWYLVLHLH